MTYPIETKKKFIALRARGFTLTNLANRLKVPHSTLGEWNLRYAPQIELARAVNWEHAESMAHMNTQHDLSRLADLIYRSWQELQHRPLHRMKTSDLLRLHFAARREYSKRRAPLMAPLERLLAAKTPPPLSPEDQPLDNQLLVISAKDWVGDQAPPDLPAEHSAPAANPLPNSAPAPSPQPQPNPTPQAAPKPPCPKPRTTAPRNPDKTGQKPDAPRKPLTARDLQDAILSSGSIREALLACRTLAGVPSSVHLPSGTTALNLNDPGKPANAAARGATPFATPPTPTTPGTNPLTDRS